jgi:hypothetical protein
MAIGFAVSQEMKLSPELDGVNSSAHLVGHG